MNRCLVGSPEMDRYVMHVAKQALWSSSLGTEHNNRRLVHRSPLYLESSLGAWLQEFLSSQLTEKSRSLIVSFFPPRLRLRQGMLCQLYGGGTQVLKGTRKFPFKWPVLGIQVGA